MLYHYQILVFFFRPDFWPHHSFLFILIRYTALFYLLLSANRIEPLWHQSYLGFRREAMYWNLAEMSSLTLSYVFISGTWKFLKLCLMSKDLNKIFRFTHYLIFDDNCTTFPLVQSKLLWKGPHSECGWFQELIADITMFLESVVIILD